MFFVLVFFQFRKLALGFRANTPAFGLLSCLSSNCTYSFRSRCCLIWCSQQCDPRRAGGAHISAAGCPFAQSKTSFLGPWVGNSRSLQSLGGQDLALLGRAGGCLPAAVCPLPSELHLKAPLCRVTPQGMIYHKTVHRTAQVVHAVFTSWQSFPFVSRSQRILDVESCCMWQKHSV